MHETERSFQTELEILHVLQDGRPHGPKEIREKVEGVLKERHISVTPGEVRQAFFRMYMGGEIHITITDNKLAVVWPSIK